MKNLSLSALQGTSIICCFHWLVCEGVHFLALAWKLVSDTTTARAKIKFDGWSPDPKQMMIRRDLLSISFNSTLLRPSHLELHSSCIRGFFQLKGSNFNSSISRLKSRTSLRVLLASLNFCYLEGHDMVSGIWVVLWSHARIFKELLLIAIWTNVSISSVIFVIVVCDFARKFL